MSQLCNRRRDSKWHTSFGAVIEWILAASWFAIPPGRDQAHVKNKNCLNPIDATGEHMPQSRNRMTALRAGVAVTALMASASAYAGGLAVREQSTFGQGASFAGIAAGGAPSSMFWNPAAMTQFYGMSLENGVSGI